MLKRSNLFALLFAFSVSLQMDLRVHAQSCSKSLQFLPCRVPFDWKFRDTCAHDGTLLCNPPSGHVSAGGKQTITLKARAGIPDVVTTIALFEVAHFEPVAVAVTIEGVYGAVAASLPRMPDAEWPETLERAMVGMQHGSRLLAATMKLGNKATKETVSRPGERAVL
jgi:hypothetical protein